MNGFWDWVGLTDKVREEAAAAAEPAARRGAAQAAGPAAEAQVTKSLADAVLKTGLIVGGVYLAYRLFLK
jgi:hypothetical protein